MRRERQRHRLRRQFEALERTFPSLGGPISSLQKNRWRMLRMPLGILMILGGFLSILPVFGIWMLPFGLLLLAVDVPFLRPPVNALLIRGRRRIELWRRWWRRKGD